jgi:hypothetical protein
MVQHSGSTPAWAFARGCRPRGGISTAQGSGNTPSLARYSSVCFMRYSKRSFLVFSKSFL